jgi:hypothetical protein
MANEKRQGDYDDLEESGCGLFEVTIPIFAGGTEDNHAPSAFAEMLRTLKDNAACIRLFHCCLEEVPEIRFVCMQVAKHL